MKRQALLAMLFVAVTMVVTVQRCVAAPALWVVQSPTSKVYLFGTVHILSDRVQWRAPEIDAAIAESQDLYLEIADVNNVRDGASEMFKLGLDHDHPLSTLLPKSDIALLDTEARKYGMPGEAMFEPMRPWFAYLMLSVLPALHQASGGSAVNASARVSGVDLQIREQFADAGKPILGFETFESQAHIFADLPQATQIAMLESALRPHAASVGKGYASIVTAWRSGDQDSLAAVLQLEQMKRLPIYAPLIGDRNAAWANTLAQRLKQPGTSFVAVGAAHLVGPNGVPALLQKMGFTVTRVQVTEPSPEPSSSAAGPWVTPSATPSAAPVSTPATPTPPPLPARLTPPAGWTSGSVDLGNKMLIIEKTWVKPMGGAVFTAHLTVPTAAIPDLDTFDSFFHQGLVGSVGASNVTPSRHVRICGGTQDGLYTTVKTNSVKEDFVLTISDRVYLAQYVRFVGAKDDPAAINSLLTLCAP